jgi:hypothetical protein
LPKCKSSQQHFDEHLSGEEEQVISLINEYWGVTTERGAAFLSGKNLRLGIALVATLLEACAADQHRRFLAGMAPPQRLLASRLGRRTLANHQARLDDLRS